MTFTPERFWEALIEDLADPGFREMFIDSTLQLQADYQEMMLEEELAEEEAQSSFDEWRDCTDRVFYVHKRTVDCDVHGCAIHNPSYHPLSDAKQYMRADKYWLIERICQHGIGHPDPDSASFIAKQQGSKGIWVHGCDGCCREPEKPSKVERGWGLRDNPYEGMTPDMFGYEGDY